MLAKGIERDDLQRPLVGRGEDDEGRRPILVGAQPVGRGHAPAVARLQAGEAVERHGGDQVVADPALVLEELGGDDRADRVAAEVLGAGVAAAVAEEPGDGVVAAGLQRAAEDVPLAHLVQSYPDRAGRTCRLRSSHGPADRLHPRRALARRTEGALGAADGSFARRSTPARAGDGAALPRGPRCARRARRPGRSRARLLRLRRVDRRSAGRRRFRDPARRGRGAGAASIREMFTPPA